MQKIITQALIKWLPTGAGAGVTAHFLVSQEWQSAIVSTFFTACSSLWVKFSGKFMETLEAEAEKRGQSSAEQLIATVDSLPAKLRRHTSGFLGEYQQSLVEVCCDFKTEGFRIGLPVLDLEDVFVPLKVETEIPSRITSAIVQAEQLAESHDIWHFLAAVSETPTYRCIAVIAPPGYGKTTLLRHLTLTFAKNAHQKYKVPKFIPVLLYLRAIREQITSAEPPSLPELILIYFQHQPAFAGLTPPTNWFEEQLKDGKCLVMLDGLDEVADTQERILVSRWVNQQMETYRKTAFIITSRPYGYRTAPVDEVGVILEVLPFSLKQMKQFIHSWYLHTEIRSRVGRNTPSVRAESKSLADDLIDRIMSNRAIADMAKSPLLVTMIATVHYCGSALPGRRVELYQKICELLLGARQEAKNIQIPLTAEQSKSVLQILALVLMQQKIRTFQPIQVQKLIQNQLERIVNNTLTSEAFLENIKNVSGLLVEREQDVLEFAHLSFQEYLAASQVKEFHQESILIENFENPWWAETIRLYAAQSDATILIRTALNNRTISSLALAYDCLKESKRVEPDAQRQLEAILEAGLESDEPQIANIAAQVRLTRRLKNLLKIDEIQEIDLSYITCAEYKLFRNLFDVKDTGKKLKFSSTDASKPITGIDFQDVNRFCAWLSLNAPVKQDKQIHYRLPTADEVQHYPAKDYPGLECWMLENQKDGQGIRIVKDKWLSQYTQLLDYLAIGKWKEADQETARIMLKVANREAEGWLNEESIQKFSNQDLRSIDQLWLQYSEGRFGFSVQKRIYEQEGKDYFKMCDRIGWRVQGEWLAYDKLQFDLTAPVGYLPSRLYWATGIVSGNAVGWGMEVLLLSRRDL